MKRFALRTVGVMVMALTSLAGGAPALAGNVRLRVERRGRRHQHLHAAARRRAAGRRARQGGERRDADGREPGPPLSLRRVRSKPFSVHAYAIDRGTGGLKQLSTSPLAESFPYISLDRTGRFLLGASYGGHLVSVNAVGSDGKVSPSRSR